jgi:hypothetical protein
MADVKLTDFNLFISALGGLHEPVKFSSISLPVLREIDASGGKRFEIAPVSLSIPLLPQDPSPVVEALGKICEEIKAEEMKGAPKPRPPLRAFEVLEQDEWTGGIVFARHNIEARKIGSHRWHDGEIGGLKSRRVPWADPYAEDGHVPAGLAIEHGWNFECRCCGRRIDSDGLHDRRMNAKDVIGYVDGVIFCNEGCARRQRALDRMRKRREREAIRWMRSVVIKRFGPVQFVTGRGSEHVYVTNTWMGKGMPEHWQVEQAIVSFTFLGQKVAPACLRYDIVEFGFRTGPNRPAFACCNGDLEAFGAWAAATPRPACIAGSDRA